jgi:predicted membrane channel-forming protein YqfA (hemolysin III family)
VTAMHSAAGELASQLGATAPSAGVVRGVAPGNRCLRGWLHLVWSEASLALGTLVLARTHGGVPITAMAVFVASVSAMLGVSALYHRGNWTAAWHRRLQRLDHAMIFLLIAGTATPAFLLATRGGLRVACLIVIWALTLTAAAIHMAWMNAPELRRDVCRTGLDSRPCPAGGVAALRGRSRNDDARGRPAVHGWRAVISLALA